MTKTERNLNSISRFSTLDRRTSNFRSRLLRKPAPDDLTERKPRFGRNFMGSIHAELAGPFRAQSIERPPLPIESS